MPSNRASKDLFAWVQVITTLVALIVVPLWYMSPLGLGFADWPRDPLTRNAAAAAYGFSFYIGIPLMLGGQVVAAILARKGKIGVAFRLLLGTFGLFFISAASVLLLISQGAG